LRAMARSFLAEQRTGRNVRQQWVALLGQSVDSRVAACADINDADRLSRAPAMRLVVSRRARGQHAAARNTVGRFETGILTTAGNQVRLPAFHVAWISEGMAHTKTQRLILDLDSSESLAHGQQGGQVQRPLRQRVLPPAVLLQPVRRHGRTCCATLQA
jgi:hypothetical protein